MTQTDPGPTAAIRNASANRAILVRRASRPEPQRPPSPTDRSVMPEEAIAPAHRPAEAVKGPYGPQPALRGRVSPHGVISAVRDAAEARTAQPMASHVTQLPRSGRLPPSRMTNLLRRPHHGVATPPGRDAITASGCCYGTLHQRSVRVPIGEREHRPAQWARRRHRARRTRKEVAARGWKRPLTGTMSITLWL